MAAVTADMVRRSGGDKFPDLQIRTVVETHMETGHEEERILNWLEGSFNPNPAPAMET